MNVRQHHAHPGLRERFAVHAPYAATAAGHDRYTPRYIESAALHGQIITGRVVLSAGFNQYGV
jgi:hypothetical protein